MSFGRVSMISSLFDEIFGLMAAIVSGAPKKVHLPPSILLVFEVEMFVVSKRQAARFIWRESIAGPAANTVTLVATSDLKAR